MDIDVDHVARLALLELTDEERTLFAHQLADILSYFDQIRAVDTTNVPPTSHALAQEANLRDDVPQPCLDRDDALRNAPDAALRAGLFRVPRVIGE